MRRASKPHGNHPIRRCEGVAYLRDIKDRVRKGYLEFREELRARIHRQYHLPEREHGKGPGQGSTTFDRTSSKDPVEQNLEES